MSKVFEKALEYVKNEISSNKSKKTLLQIEFPEFRDGDFIVNLYIDGDPPLLGRVLDRDIIEFTPKIVRHIFRFGLLHGCTIHRIGQEFYYVRDGKIVAVIGRRHYAASEPKLFEEISREIYGIGGERIIDIDKPLGWSKALKMITKL
ncbi:MAG: hypothetical protein QXK95_05625 [Nitrososphaerota archaeon]|nr:hypothetical protein [Candidatus Geocrenenecus dongiae]